MDFDSLNLSSKLHRSDFYPIESLEGKRNYKQCFRIERDGTIRETVHLEVTEAARRESIICRHYLRHLVRHFFNESIGVNILGRDCPWDFKLQFSTERVLFVEITSIANEEKHFTINKREERFKKWTAEERIPLYELRKIAHLFPDKHLENIIRGFEQAGVSDSKLVVNPIIQSEPVMFLSTLNEKKESLAKCIRLAVEQKVNKSHAGKESTVLIIDNRASVYDLHDYQSAAEELKPILDGFPFPEIWFYTGYFSDDDGNNAEFSFAPLKATSAQTEIMRQLSVNSKGQHIWS